MSFDQFLLLLVGILFACSLGFMAFSIFTRVPEAYSAAYLSPIPLNQVELNQPYPLEFFIENHQGKAMDYFYEIFWDNKKIMDKTVQLQNNEKKTIQESISIPDSFSGKKKLLIQVHPFDEKINAFAKDSFELWVWLEEKE